MAGLRLSALFSSDSSPSIFLAYPVPIPLCFYLGRKDRREVVMTSEMSSDIPLFLFSLVQLFIVLLFRISVYLLCYANTVFSPATAFSSRKVQASLDSVVSSSGLQSIIWTCFGYLVSRPVISLISYLHDKLCVRGVSRRSSHQPGLLLWILHYTLNTFITQIEEFIDDTTTSSTVIDDAPVTDSDESTKLTVVLESSSLASLSITPPASPTDVLSLFPCAVSPTTPTTPCLSPPTPSTPVTPEGPTLVNDDCDENVKDKSTPANIIIISSTPKRQPLAPLPIIPISNKNKTQQHSSPILKTPSERKILPSSYTAKENQYPPPKASKANEKEDENEKKKRSSSKGTYYRKDTFMAALKMDMIPIGEGGFGQVFRATAVGSQTLAVKLMQRGTLAQEIAILNEVNALRAAKGCRWAVEMVYFQAVEEQALIALTYIPGGDMHSYWERAGFCLDFDTARFYTAQLILAIHDLHTRGIIHRDIKLENMMLDSRRNLKLVDFGLAQVFDHNTVSERDYPLFYQMKKLGGDVFPLLWATSHNPHQTDLSNGTEGYAPPEVWKSQMHSFGIDYFAMGCVLHLLITGNAPFEFDSVAQDYDYNDIHVEKSMEVDAYDFLRRVLANRPGTRPNVRRMKIHPVFRGIDWDALAASKVEAPPYPYGH